MFNLIKAQWIGIVALVVVALVAFAPSSVDVVTDTLGADSTNYTNTVNFKGGLVAGGGVTATSTVGSSALLYSAIDTENVVAMTLTGGAGTLSLPASSTFTGMTTEGDTRTIYIQNASTSAGAILTVAGNTGVLLKRAASSTATVIGDTDGANFFRIDLLRKSNRDIEALLTKFED